MVDVKLNVNATAPVQGGFSLDGVPSFSVADVDAVCARSHCAHEVRTSLQDAVDEGRVFSGIEIRDLLERATPKGKGREADRNSAAVVVAYYAQNHQHIFSKSAQKELKAWSKDVTWADVKAWLDDFMAKEAEKKREAEKEAAIKKELLEDDLKRDDRKRQLVKDNGTKADRAKEVRKREATKHVEKERIASGSDAFLDEELTSSGRVPLSDVESTKLKMQKRAFSKH